MAGREVLGAVFVVLVGCSSETTVVVPNCGPGTVAKDGVCVPAEGDGGADGGADSSLDTTPPPTDSGVDFGGTETLVDSGPSDSPADTAGGDPCPAKMTLNCSSTCGAPTPTECASATCSSPSRKYYLDKIESLPFVMRLPNAPGVDPECKKACTFGTTTYGKTVWGFYITLYLPTGAPPIRARVAAPWKIGLGPSGPFCTSETAKTCQVTTTGQEWWAVLTEDPSAPARNLIIEKVPDSELSTPCP